MGAAADGQMDLINRLSAASCGDVYARDQAGCTAVWWALNLCGEGEGARGMHTSLTIASLISSAIQLPIPNPAAMLPLGPPPLSMRETLRLLPPPTDTSDGTITTRPHERVFSIFVLLNALRHGLCATSVTRLGCS